MTTHGKTILLNLALLGTSVLVAVVITEVTLRVFPGLLPESAQLRVHWNDLIAEETVSHAHPTIGFLYPADYEGEIRRGDLQFSYTTDENGFRNDGPWPDTAEIVALGDSQTFGYGVSGGESWPALLADALPRLRVLNLGLIGGSPQQYRRIYQTFGSAAHPKLVIFGLFAGNDLNDARSFQDWLDEGAEGNYDVWRFFGGNPEESGGGVRGWLESTYLVTALREIRNSFGTAFAGETFETADGSRLRLAPSVYRGNARRAQPGHRDFELVIETILAARSEAEADGASFLVLILPPKEEVYLPLLGRTAPEAAGPLARRLEEEGVQTLDLTPPFRERAEAGEALYFEVDGHTNARGYALMAEVLLGHIRENPERFGLAVLE